MNSDLVQNSQNNIELEFTTSNTSKDSEILSADYRTTFYSEVYQTKSTLYDNDIKNQHNRRSIKGNSFLCKKVLQIQIKSESALNDSESYILLNIIGSGGVADVFKAQNTKTKEICAVKKMQKSIILSKCCQKQVLNENKVLRQIYHPLLINRINSFQTEKDLYLILQYQSQGDLRHHMQYQQFDEQQIKFIIACIIQVVSYIHSKNYIHRDIKPENLIFGEDGYLYLTDLGIVCKENEKCNYGTLGYMPLECLNQQDQSYTVDYFAIGVIAFELINGIKGRRPFTGQTYDEQIEQMCNNPIKLQQKKEFSSELVNFVNQLIYINPKKRLGRKGIFQIKSHPFFRNFDWKSLANKEMQINMNLKDIQETQQMQNILLQETHYKCNLFQNY